LTLFFPHILVLQLQFQEAVVELHNFIEAQLGAVKVHVGITVEIQSVVEVTLCMPTLVRVVEIVAIHGFQIAWKSDHVGFKGFIHVFDTFAVTFLNYDHLFF